MNCILSSPIILYELVAGKCIGKVYQHCNLVHQHAWALKLSLVQPLSVIEVPLLRYLGLYSNYTTAFVAV